MKIILCGMSELMCEAWARHCGDLPDVEIYEGSLFDVVADAIVSSGNGFGFMNGSIDAQIKEYLGEQVEIDLREIIASEYFGELLVGQAVIVGLQDNDSFKYMISAPTMRMPEELPAATINPYLATRAVLQVIVNGVCDTPDGEAVPVSEVIRSVAFPGLGTGISGVTPERCAWQMRQAILDVVLEPVGLPRDWDEATERHIKLMN